MEASINNGSPQAWAKGFGGADGYGEADHDYKKAKDAGMDIQDRKLMKEAFAAIGNTNQFHTSDAGQAQLVRFFELAKKMQLTEDGDLNSDDLQKVIDVLSSPPGDVPEAYKSIVDSIHENKDKLGEGPNVEYENNYQGVGPIESAASAGAPQKTEASDPPEQTESADMTQTSDDNITAGASEDDGAARRAARKDGTSEAEMADQQRRDNREGGSEASSKMAAENATDDGTTAAESAPSALLTAAKQHTSRASHIAAPADSAEDRPPTNAQNPGPIYFVNDWSAKDVDNQNVARDWQANNLGEKFTSVTDEFNTADAPTGSIGIDAAAKKIAEESKTGPVSIAMGGESGQVRAILEKVEAAGGNLSNIHVVSHSERNEMATDEPTVQYENNPANMQWIHDSDVKFTRIADQNEQAYYKGTSDNKSQDVSDLGMLHYLLTGDETPETRIM